MSGPVTLNSPTIATPTMTGQAVIPSINLTGGQIVFPATQNSSANANTLDDYEEGTFTPQITVEGASAPLNANTVREATYTKIGNTVRVTVNATWNNVTANGVTSAILITNMPFPFALTTNDETSMTYGTHFSTGAAGLTKQLVIRAFSSGAVFAYLYAQWGTSLPQTFTYMRVDSNPITNGTATTFNFSFVYRTIN
jgi:hypothetical protein